MTFKSKFKALRINGNLLMAFSSSCMLQKSCILFQKDSSTREYITTYETFVIYVCYVCVGKMN